MAQNSAHLTQTLQPKPSIFEVIASDSLETTFQPAFKRVAHVSHSISTNSFKNLIEIVYIAFNVKFSI